MHPSVLRGMPRSCLAHVLGILHHVIHARATQTCPHLHPSGGILSDCHPPLGDDHEARHETVDRLWNHHHGKGGRGGDQNGSSWDRWL